MTGKEHYQTAEALLDAADGSESISDSNYYNAQALVHATLALAAAQIMPYSWAQS